ncbi:TraR/DksA C4-type zinc finger protein [Humitalea sp. 24SJ18S-53]|uniref:TraR/DksA C4-type zinc finger protein n=1 Tax=Humitalea sp. 24SJ18S-53 TaxID=3422307 RepID=UPI003D6738E8
MALADADRDAAIARRRRPATGEAAEACELCDAQIPAARRLAVPGVRLCVACQGRMENVR